MRVMDVFAVWVMVFGVKASKAPLLFWYDCAMLSNDASQQDTGASKTSVPGAQVHGGEMRVLRLWMFSAVCFGVSVSLRCCVILCNWLFDCGVHIEARILHNYVSR